MEKVIKLTLNQGEKLKQMETSPERHRGCYKITKITKVIIRGQ